MPTPMPAELSSSQALELWRETLVSWIVAGQEDLSARQMAILLTIYLTEGEHTVRRLAELLKVSKSVITRAVDKLARLGLVRRRPDPKDRRTVFLRRTVAGSVFLRDYADTIVRSSGK